MSRMARKDRSRNLVPLATPTAIPDTPIGTMTEPWQSTAFWCAAPLDLTQPAFMKSMASPLLYFVEKNEMILLSEVEASAAPPEQASSPRRQGTRAAS